VHYFLLLPCGIIHHILLHVTKCPLDNHDYAQKQSEAGPVHKLDRTLTQS